MPYIVTILNTTVHGEPMEDQSAADVDGAIRTAVATLDEARDRVIEEISPLGLATIENVITAEGGTISLPGGTVIEVQAVSWNWVIGMADDAGIDTDAVYEDGGDLAILAALDAKL